MIVSSHRIQSIHACATEDFRDLSATHKEWKIDSSNPLTAGAAYIRVFIFY